MKPFTLESVLNYRIQLEKIAKNRLLAAQRKRTKIFMQIQEKERLFHGLIEDLEGRRYAGMEVMEMIRYEERIDVVKAEIASLHQILAARDEEVRKEREETLIKSKERKVMEKLKEKQNAAWQQYLNKKEAALLDEIAVIFHER